MSEGRTIGQMLTNVGRMPGKIAPAGTYMNANNKKAFMQHLDKPLEARFT